jgi:hypothetical protein
MHPQMILSVFLKGLLGEIFFFPVLHGLFILIDAVDHAAFDIFKERVYTVFPFMDKLFYSHFYLCL